MLPQYLLRRILQDSRGVQVILQVIQQHRVTLVRQVARVPLVTTLIRGVPAMMALDIWFRVDDYHIHSINLCINSRFVTIRTQLSVVAIIY